MAFVKIRDALGMNKSNFSSRVIQAAYMKAKFEQLGYRVEKIGRSKVVTKRKEVAEIDADN